MRLSCFLLGHKAYFQVRLLLVSGRVIYPKHNITTKKPWKLTPPPNLVAIKHLPQKLLSKMVTTKNKGFFKFWVGPAPQDISSLPKNYVKPTEVGSY